MTKDSTTRGYWIALLAIVVLGVLLRLYHFHLTIGCDDQLYLITAQALGETPRTDISPYFYARILWRVALAAWGTVAGFSLESSAVLMLLLSCVTVYLVAETARRAFGNLAGLMGAALFATHPINVVFDTFTLPDNLAVALLAASLLFFLEYLRNGRAGSLLAAGFLVGLLFSVKDYYVLAGLPLAAAVLLQKIATRPRLRDVALLAASGAAGVSVDLALHWTFSGNALAHLTASSNYGERRLAVDPERRGNIVRVLHSVWWERAEYFKWLLVEYSGVVTGFLMLWGAVFLGWMSRRRADCRLLAGVAAVFLAFLMFMPVSFRPLVLVEMQPRYLTVLLPALCIGAGAALSHAWASMRDPAVRGSAAAAVIAGICYNAVVPNDLIDHHRVQEFTGIRHVLEDAREQGIEELVLPEPYDLFLPDSYRRHGVEFSYRDAEDRDAFSAIDEYLAERPGRAAFLPERPYPRTDAYQQLRETLRAQGFSVEEVRVPRSTYRSWLRRFDLIDATDQLVGWVARPTDESSSHEQQQEGGLPPVASQ